jgi:hypothetical protein
MQELAASLKAISFANPWTEDRARRWWLANGRQTRETGIVKVPSSSATPKALAG